MKSLSKLLAAIVMAGAMSSASATMLSFGINLSGSVVLTPAGDISLATTLKTIPTADTVSSCAPLLACTTAGIVAAGPAIFSVGTLRTTLGPDVFNIVAGLLTFHFTDNVLATIVATGPTSAGFISLQFTGFVTGDLSAGSTFLGQTVTLSETCTQTGALAVITCSESVQTPGIPRQVPEPMSLALLGIGLVALGFVRRRKI